MEVLRRVQKVFERLHGGFARVQKGLEVSSWGGLHVYKKVLKLVQGAFARVQKGIEVTSRRFCIIS